MMPRYFFQVDDGFSTRDEAGTELPDIFAAQDEAIRFSGERLRDMGGKFWDGTAWNLAVTDETGRVLFTLRFMANEATDLDSRRG
jgi:hypothetical protein